MISQTKKPSSDPKGKSNNSLFLQKSDEESFLSKKDDPEANANSFVPPSAMVTDEQLWAAEDSKQDKEPVTPPVKQTPGFSVNINGPVDLWWFQNENPPGYDITANLSATNSTGVAGTYTWTIINGATRADFNGQPTVNGSNATVKSKGASVAQNDVKVKVDFVGSRGEQGTAEKTLTIKAPNSLGNLGTTDIAHATWGYESRINYNIKDQFGAILPSNVPINEQWDGPIVADFNGMNWRRGAEGSLSVPPARWFDRVQGENPAGPRVPLPLRPTDPGAGVAVYHWPGTWRVGSLVIGKGKSVKSVTWSKYRGRARHT